MVEEDIHKIWTIWGIGGLLDKLGPERTIRELKKRCDAGAIIGCTLYKLMIDKWMHVALSAGSIDPVTEERTDPHEAGPAIQLMLAAGEDEYVNKILELRKQYGDTIPRSVELDLRDEFNLNLEKKVGRRIPLSPNDASKKDIEDSKRIAARMGAGEIAPVAPVKKVIPVEKEKEKEKPPPKPEAAPLPTPPTPVKVTPPTLELMEEEIKKRAEALRKKKATGELEAGEAAEQYPEDKRPLKSRYRDFVQELRVVIRNLPPRDKGGFERGMIFSREYNRLRKKHNIPMSIPADIIKQVGEVPKLEKSEIAKSIVSTMAPPEELKPGATPPLCPGIPGSELCKWCRFKYTVTSVRLCPHRPEFRGTIGEGDIKKIVGIVARETGEPETRLSKSFLEYIRRIEMVRGMDSLPDLKEYFQNVDTIQVMTDYDKLQLKRFIIQRMQEIIDYYEKNRPAFPEQFRENNEPKNEDEIQEPRDYTQWTFGDFENFISALEDIEDLEELNEYIDASDKISQNDAITLRNLIKTRIDELAKGYSELSKIGG